MAQTVGEGAYEVNETASAMDIVRCFWVGDDPLMIAYHDREWGTPCHDDRKLFELLMLDVNQAGLSWSLIIRRREAFRRAFDGWDPERIARYEAADLERLLADPGIIRNRLKIAAAVRNARAFLEVQREHGSFDCYLWSFVGGRPIRHTGLTSGTIPASTAESDVLSKDLKQRGFTFVGSTVVYAFMQSVGLVDDHVPECFRYQGA
jgi:DNA-3-methyladenine glycosylase I